MKSLGVLVIFSLIALAGPPAKKIKIDCVTSDGKPVCSVTPKSLQLEPGDTIAVQTTSGTSWTCAIRTEDSVPVSNQASDGLETCASQKGTGRLILSPKPPVDAPTSQPDPVEVEVVFSNPESSLLAPPNLFLQALASILAFAVLGAGFLVFQSSGEPDERIEGLIKSAEDLKRRINQISPVLAFSYSQSAPQPRIERSQPEPQGATRAPQALEAFLQVLDEWSRHARGLPQDITPLRDSLMKGQVRSASDLRSLTDNIVTIAVRASDGSIDRERHNAGLQGSLKRLIRSSGITDFSPKPGEKFDPVLHHATGVAVQASNAMQRNCVAAVLIRGLTRDDQIISTAEVTLFD